MFEYSNNEKRREMAGCSSGTAGAEVRCCLNTRSEHNEAEGNRVNGENCSLAVLFCVTIRASDETCRFRRWSFTKISVCSIYRPRGVIDEAAVKRVVAVLEDLEAKLQEPFNRFSDTLAADEVELNFKYVIQVSLCRRLSYAGHPPVKSAILSYRFDI